MANIVGTAGGDYLRGGTGNDTIQGLEGADNLAGEGGDDVVEGGAGNDDLYCGAGNDTLYGGDGDDKLTLRNEFQPMGSNTLDGGAGNDTINLYAGDDVLGVNTFIGGSGDDWFYVFCQPENFTAGQHFIGGDGFDRITVQIFGGDMTGAIIDPGIEGIMYTVTDDLKLTAAQADIFVEIIATNLVVTTAGTINLSDATRLPERITLTVPGTVLNMSGANAYEFVQVHGSAGVDTITGTAKGDHVSGGDGADVLDGDGDNDNVWGEGGNDNLAGGAGDDYLDGGDGADTLNGGDGADLLDGGAGVDTFFGGAGDDTIRFQSGSGPVAGETVSGGAGIDKLTVWYDQNTDLTVLSFAHDIEVLEAGNVTMDADDLTGFREIHATQITIVSAGVADLSSTLFYMYEPIVLAVGGIWLDVSLSDTDGTPVDVTGSSGVDHVTGGRTVVAGGGGDVLTGDARSNEYRGGDGDDLMSGGDGADDLGGGGGQDTIDGGDGNDGIDGGADNDQLGGGAGVDLILGGAGDDVIEGGAGDDNLFGDGGADTLSYAHAAGAVTVDLSLALTSGADGADNLSDFENVTGSAFDDILIGTSGVNVLQGGGGDDILKGGGGVDTLDGGAGADALDYSHTAAVVLANFATGVVTIGGGAPEDTLISIEGIMAGSADDTLIGGAEANWLSGGDGDDELKGGAGADRLDGGDGIDTVDYSDHGQTVILTLADGGASVTVGKAAADTLTGIENVIGGAVRDQITGDTGDNQLSGGGGSDGLVGGLGNDLLDGGIGSDTMAGGLGDDTYVVDHVADKATEVYGSGADLIEASVSWVLSANFENLTLTGTGATNGTGNGLNNTIVGNYRANVLTGGNGDDVLQGGDGNDRLDGGAGADTMQGGLGHDTYVVSNTLDTLVENVGEGTDIIESRVAWTLADNFENLTLTGTSNVAGTGNSVANTILGNDGNNVLTGLGGNDRLEGGLGADTLLGGDGADIMEGGAGLDVFTGGASTDRFLFDEPDMAGLTSTTCDRITDFSGDRIGLTDIDAKTATADVDDAFTFIGTGAFTGVAGQLRYEQVGGNTLITGDVNGDGVADFMIRLDGLHTLTAASFFL